MKTPRATLVAAAVPLLLASLPLTAGELPFHAPDTARAQETVQLLHQAARALGDQPAASSLADLWIFPTADADTVFAQYELSSNEEGGGSTKHLTVLKVRGNRILEQTELTDPRAYSASDEGAPSATAHWSALIGTGHASSTDATISAHGVPGTPNWTARIGTGTAASSVGATESHQPSSSTNRSATADAHWTSRIGTGHVSESNGREGT